MSIGCSSALVNFFPRPCTVRVMPSLVVIIWSRVVSSYDDLVTALCKYCRSSRQRSVVLVGRQAKSVASRGEYRLFTSIGRADALTCNFASLSLVNPSSQVKSLCERCVRIIGFVQIKNGFYGEWSINGSLNFTSRWELSVIDAPLLLSASSPGTRGKSSFAFNSKKTLP